jgi:ATP-dependent helicase/nuclease subunit A
LVYKSGDAPQALSPPEQTVGNPPLPVGRIKGPFPLANPYVEIAPSYEAGHVAPAASPAGCGDGKITEEDNQLRGVVIHRVLQLLAEGLKRAQIMQHVYNDYAVSLGDPAFKPWLQEAENVFNHKPLQHIYDPAQYIASYNEVPMMYRRDGCTVYGVIDRLVVKQDEVLVIDYKTHQFTGAAQKKALLDLYTPQLRHYAEGAARCWPDKSVEGYLLFTHINCLASI